MGVRKVEKGYLVDLRPYGASGKRIRKTFSTKKEAERFEAYTKQDAVQSPWNPKQKDTRTLYYLIQLWWDNHGKTIKSGAICKKELENFCSIAGNPPGRKLSAQDFYSWRSIKLDDEMKPTTINLHLSYLKALFNTLIEQDLIDYENPFRKVKPIKTQEVERNHYSKEEVKQLLEGLDLPKHREIYLMTYIGLATGGRWSEIHNLGDRSIINGKVRFANTKSRKIREVAISPETEQCIREYVALPDRASSYTSARRFGRAAEKLGLKTEGQATHAIRHTFAAHFMMNGGNIVTLQRILGHSNIKTTMIYVHFAPEHLEQAKHLNPVDWTKSGH